MRRNTRYVLASTLAAGLVLVVCLAALAQGDGGLWRGGLRGPFVPADAPAAEGQRLPASVAQPKGEKVNVLIEMDAPPLAEVYIAEKAKGVAKVDEGLQAKYVAQLKADQAKVAGEAAKRGKVLFNLTNFVNGVGVTGVDTRDLAALQSLPGVKAVHVMGTFKYDLGQSVPFIGGQQVLEEYGLDGRGTRVAVIDTGIDYTHRDFGGPGTVDAYNFAKADPARLPGPYNGVTLFPTEKIPGGYDFVGDTWTGANPGEGITETLEMSPDPNPIDMVGEGPGGVVYEGGHGTHTSGITAGMGVPNSSVNGSIPTSFVRPTDAYTVFHGVAPAAQIYHYKVCSSLVNNCDGLAMIAGFDRAADPNGDGNMNDHVDAINMSIGSLFAADVSTEDAANRAVRAGVAVAISAGNSSDVPFITGAPASAERALSVAASTSPNPIYALAVTAPANATGLQIPFVWQAWSAPLTAAGVSGPLIEARTVVTMTAATAKLGCTQPGGVNPFPAGSLAGKIAVIDRGTCAISEKGYNAQQAGAIGAIVVSQNGNPPAGASLGGPAPTIPVVMIAYQNGQALYQFLRANQTVTVTIGSGNVIGTLADVLAGFTSRGPSRFGNPKPDISAPGVDIVSAGAGTGNQGVAMSGTSMAAPHVAGSLALMKQAHPTWTPTEREAVLVNTAKPEVYTYNFVTPDRPRAPISLGGAGRVDLVAAASADTVVLGDLLAHVGYGAQAVAYTFTATKPITVENKSTATKTYELSTTFEVTQPLPSGVSVTVSPTTLTVPAGGSANATVTMTLTPQFLQGWRLTGAAAGLGASLTRVEVAGVVAARDQGTGRQYRVPFYALPRSASDIDTSATALTLTTFGADNPATFTLTNRAYYTGTADLFHLMIVDPKDVPTGVVTATERLDIQYVGARYINQASFTGVTTPSVEFGIKTFAPRMLPIEAEFDVNIDLNGDGNPEYVVFNVDQGTLGGACCNGVNVVAVYNVATRSISGPYNYTDTNVWSSNLIMRVPASAIDLTTPRKFNFWVEAYWNFPGYTNIQEESTAPLLDRAPNSGSVAFNPALVRFNPVNPTNGQTSYRIPVLQGTARSVNVYANLRGWLNASPTENSEQGMLILYRDNVPGARDADVVRTSFPFQFQAFEQTLDLQADASGYVSNRFFMGDLGRNFGSTDMWTGEDNRSGLRYLGIASFPLPTGATGATSFAEGQLMLTLGDTTFLDNTLVEAEFGVRYAGAGNVLQQTFNSLVPLGVGNVTPVLDDDAIKGKEGTTYTFMLDATTLRAMRAATTSGAGRLSFMSYGRITGGVGRAFINWQGARSANPPRLSILGFTCTGGTCP